MNTKSTLAMIVGVSCLAASCSKVRKTLELIEADGQAYAACHNFVWISIEGKSLEREAGYTVKYTDANGLWNVLYSVQTLSFQDLPRLVPAPLPHPLPDVRLGLDGAGNPFEEGKTYTWSDGSQATLRNDAWIPVMRPNPACQSD